MSADFELFPGKNLSGLFKDIYDNQQTKKLRISELIAEMRKLIRHSGDMMVMGPIIRDLIDSSIKNDDSLIKMAAIEETVYEVADEQDVRVDELTNEIEELKQKVGNGRR